MKSIDDLSNSLKELATTENLENTLFIILKFIIIAAILMIVVLTVLGLLNNKRTYNPKIIWDKRGIRTSTEETGGGQEYYFRYWIWQRNKRKNILTAIRKYTKDGEYYPKQKWLKRGKVKLPLRREIWVIK